jgi:hypothetical protein
MRKAAVRICRIFLKVSSALLATMTAVRAMSRGGYLVMECRAKKR